MVTLSCNNESNKGHTQNFLRRKTFCNLACIFQFLLSDGRFWQIVTCTVVLSPNLMKISIIFKFLNHMNWSCLFVLPVLLLDNMEKITPWKSEGYWVWWGDLYKVINELYGSLVITTSILLVHKFIAQRAKTAVYHQRHQ